MLLVKFMVYNLGQCMLELCSTFSRAVESQRRSWGIYRIGPEGAGLGMKWGSEFPILLISPEYPMLVTKLRIFSFALLVQIRQVKDSTQSVFVLSLNLFPFSTSASHYSEMLVSMHC